MRTWLAVAALLLAAAPASGQLAVAVLDTGVDAGHPELAGRVERMSFVATVPGLPLPIDPGLASDDPDGQGTGVASVVAGSSLGVSPDARILDLQVTAPYTGTQLDPTAEAAAVSALDWLLRNPGGPDGGARIALLSFAAAGISDEGASTMAAQAQALWEAGVAVVVPVAGTLSPLHTSRHVLTVGPSESCGASADQADLPPKPDLVAPSQGIEVATPGTGPLPGATGTASGTPYAAAQVAGTAALMWQARPDLPIQALYDLLRATAAGDANDGFDACTGFGGLDTEAAVAAAVSWEDARPATDGNGTPAPGAALLGIGLLTAALIARRR